MALKNRKEKTKWMNQRMKKGYSFIYEKGLVNGEMINKTILCVDTEEILDLEWD
jgi:hypothetical protein